MDFGFRTDFKDVNFINEIIKQNSEIFSSVRGRTNNNIPNKKNKEIFESLEPYIEEGNVLSAKKIEEAIFPIPEKIDIFISHSRKDVVFAKIFANCLEIFGINCFIDSRIWGNIDDLIQTTANKFCVTKYKSDNKTPELYGYDYINRTNSNIHMILSMALTKVINNSRIFCFIGTENSASFESTIKDEEIAKTFSPWLYLELIISKILYENKKLKKTANYSNYPLFQFETSIEHLPVLTEDKFVEFIENPSKDLETLKNIITDEISYTLFEE